MISKFPASFKILIENFMKGAVNLWKLITSLRTLTYKVLTYKVSTYKVATTLIYVKRNSSL